CYHRKPFNHATNKNIFMGSCLFQRPLLPFWNFQIAVWSAFILLTFPAKLEISGSLLTALGSCVARAGFSFLLTCEMRRIYDHFYQTQQKLWRIVGTVLIVSMLAAVLQLPVFFLVGHVLPFEEKTWFDKAVPLGIFYYRTGLFVCWSFLYFSVKLSG